MLLYIGCKSLRKTNALFLGVKDECVVLFHRRDAVGFICSASLDVFGHFSELPFTHMGATDAISNLVLVLPLFTLQELAVALLASPSFLALSHGCVAVVVKPGYRATSYLSDNRWNIDGHAFLYGLIKVVDCSL